MSIKSMSSRDRRAMFWGLGILLPALAYIWGVKPLLASLGEARRQVVEQRQLLSNEEAAVAAARRNPDVQRLADSAMRAMAPRLFEGRDDVMATAELVSHLGEVARQSNVLLQSATTRATTLSDGVRTLHVEIRGESDLTGVLAFLQSLEGGEKLIRVERMDISKSLAAAEEKGIEPLAIVASIVGFAIPDPSAPAQPAAHPPGRAQAPTLPLGGR
jgi:hypothetical protein